jgi:hypothetical protein
MRVTRASLERVMPIVRNLFGATGFNVARHGDAEIITAILAVCPVWREGAPTDSQLAAVVQHLGQRFSGQK